MSTEQKQNLVNDVSSIAPFFKVSVKIEVFGHVIWEFTYPPKSN